MDHPIMADLKVARDRGWERLRLLVGQWVYWKQLRKISEEDRARYRSQSEIQAEMLELVGLLAPNQELEFVIYTTDSVKPEAVFLKLQQHGPTGYEVKPWVGAPIAEPIEPPIAEPEADRPDDDDPTDLLKALEG